MSAADTETTRERLLAAARDLFQKRGFAATSTRAIAAQADCNLSLIKYYFGSKEGLLREMLRFQYDTIGSEIREQSLRQGTATDRLTEVIAKLAERIDDNRDTLRMIIRELTTADSPVIQEIAELIRQIQSPIIELLQDAQSSGEIRDIDPRFAGVSLAGMLMFYHLAYPVTSILVEPRNAKTLDALRDTVVRIFLHGVLNPQPPKKETSA